MSSFFTSKILLFGEYSIVLGSQGLAIPFPKFGGKLRFQSDNEKNARVSNGHLREFYNHLESIPDFHFAEMKRDLDAGLFFDSNIPQGYGAGSSGALCAAIY